MTKISLESVCIYGCVSVFQLPKRGQVMHAAS